MKIRGPRVPLLYTGERHGNFSYSIPVVPGSYTVKLYFLESFFSLLIPAATCQGVGCRVFDVTCNGVMLLQDFDVIQAAWRLIPACGPRISWLAPQRSRKAAALFFVKGQLRRDQGY